MNFPGHKYGWIYENRVNTLHQIAPMHFDFTTPNGVKITPGDGKKNKNK